MGAASLEPTSTSLLERAKAHEPDAWRYLIELYGPLVYLWARQAELQAEDAGDVVQEVFAAVAQGIGRFRRDQPGDSFRGWLWTITRNKIQDHFRRRQAEPPARGGTDAQQQIAQIPEATPPSERGDLPVGHEQGLTRHAIEWVRARVGDRTWQAFWRTAVDGQPAKATAEELSMTPHAVYDAKYRVRRFLDQTLSDLHE